MRDGSGLSVQDRMPASALSQVLLAAVGTGHPELRPILTGLSVAGWDGSLVEQNRFTGTAADADGVVRAKTGSLTGVSAMAGVLTDADGRQLVFAFVADQAPGRAGDPGRDRPAGRGPGPLRLPLSAAAAGRCRRDGSAPAGSVRE